MAAPANLPALMSIIDVRGKASESGPRAYPRHRKRKWHAKVPTGCLRCKQRRVKCSEEKPYCARCSKLGLPCPGYKIPVPRIFEFRPRSAPLFESELDKTRYEYFVEVGSKILATFQLNSMPFWTRLAPRLGLDHAAVRHGLIALGALQAPLHNITVAGLQVQARPEICELAMSHTHKAMHMIRTADPMTLPVEVSLTCCLLFLAMQFWIEKTSSAAMHIMAAYRILQEKFGNDASLWAKNPDVPGDIATTFIPALNELINHACTFSDDFPPAGSGIPADYHLGYDVGQISSISDANGALDAIDRLLKCVLRATSRPGISQSLEKTIAEAFRCLDCKLQELHDIDALPRHGRDYIHLCLHLRVAKVMFFTIGRPDEAEFDAFHPHFSFIVGCCRRVIDLDTVVRPEKQSVLSPSLGILPPLFFVATRCREPRLRHEALDLLHEAGVSERGWTSCIAFAIARFVVNEEEVRLNSLPVEDRTADRIHRRIRLRDVQVCGPARTANITYLVFQQSSSEDTGPLVTAISTSERGSKDIVRCKARIPYPSHPSVEIDGVTSVEMPLLVFSPEKFQGNPLALVSVHGNALSQKRKAQIAREFRYSETVFLHDAPGPGQPRLLEIFSETGEELPFAGHPVIGAAYYIFSYLERMHYGGPADRDTQKQSAVLLTKAGRIPIFFNPYRQVAACVVPFNCHIHSHRVPIEKIITTQPHIQIIPTIDKEKDKMFPLVSIVKGMTFVLVDLTDNAEIFGALQAAKSPEVDLDAEWSPSFVGCMYYKVLAKSEQPGEPTIHNIQARMISHGIEDSGSGSACCALACYLALNSANHSLEAQKLAEERTDQGSADSELTKQTQDLKLGETKTERKVFGIQQGAEMGRLCTIAVEVDVKTDAQGKASITNVVLSGRANLHLRGEILGF
ncbi:uncharacterized protein Z519_12531 [Cladophialophora bantiana CBS 173.52]|uniref:Zn(2)-C6 fungal-type domain-containing protein n=1 Tax=Cladophialophora bantiana (strain ATCC 10958 / CBS 173.52 / CDC B-1940 / NIH 8579) TaxID=1442370 RepID=A0A0D2HR66_CLAB1|nr:uncharacterized protein Z519_12531 [Cladophialophora bantiana CBS 173.52]KIW86909.1 hypothetical protein Z519_12531 [Cladophialophora bantiana CBS 173.52]